MSKQNTSLQKLVETIVKETIKQTKQLNEVDVLSLYRMAQNAKEPEKALELIDAFLSQVNIPVPKPVKPEPPIPSIPMPSSAKQRR